MNGKESRLQHREREGEGGRGVPGQQRVVFLVAMATLAAFFKHHPTTSCFLSFLPLSFSFFHFLPISNLVQTPQQFPHPVWQTGTAHVRVLGHRSPYMLSFEGFLRLGKTQENTLSRAALSCDRRRKGRRSVRTQDMEDRWFERSVKGVIHTQMERRGGVRQLTPTISRQQERLGANFSRHAKAK